MYAPATTPLVQDERKRHVDSSDAFFLFSETCKKNRYHTMKLKLGKEGTSELEDINVEQAVTVANSATL